MAHNLYRGQMSPLLSEAIIKRGKTRRGTQRYLCQNMACTTDSFLLAYCNRGGVLCTYDLSMSQLGMLSATECVIELNQKVR